MNFMPKKVRVALVREDLVALTKDTNKAIALAQFIYWSERMKDVDKYIAEETARLNKGGIETNLSPSYGWIYKEAEEFIEETMLTISRPTANRLLKALVEDGYLQFRKNPEKKWDQTNQYRVNFILIQERLRKLGYWHSEFAWLTDGEHDYSTKEMSDAMFKMSIESKQQKNDENNHDSAMFKLSNAKIKLNNAVIKTSNRMIKSEQAIPEITTEINKDDDYTRDDQNNPLIKTEDVKTAKDSLGAVQGLETQKPEPTLDGLEWIDQTGEPPIPQGQAVAASEPTLPLISPTADVDHEETPRSHSTTTPSRDSASATSSSASIRAVDTFGGDGVDVYTAAAALTKAPLPNGQPSATLTLDMSQDQLNEIYETIENCMSAYTPKRYRLNNQIGEYATLHSLLAAGVPVTFITQVIRDVVADGYKADTFKYFAKPIAQRWAIELEKQAAPKPIDWSAYQSQSNKGGGGRSSQVKADRVVPAAQPGKYERFYQVYGNTGK